MYHSDRSNQCTEVPIMQKPLIIRYSDEESPSKDPEFLKVMGVVTKFLKPPGKKGKRPKKKGKEATPYVDIYYI